MVSYKTRAYSITLFILCTMCMSLVYVVWRESDQGILRVVFLNVGQGDAIFIESPTHGQMLIDSGPDNTVIRELGKVLPWYDRSIDVIMITNPDKDHIAGFIPVLRRYDVQKVIRPDTLNDTEINRAVGISIDKEGVQNIIAKRGQIIDLGGGALVYILFPDRGVDGLDSNTGSIIAKLVYGNTSVMLTGDAPNNALEYITWLDGDLLESSVLKAGHHGSRTSASEIFIKAVRPQYAVISAGKNNSYKHPHKETLDLFAQEKIPVLGTYDHGTITMESDGEKVWFK